MKTPARRCSVMAAPAARSYVSTGPAHFMMANSKKSRDGLNICRISGMRGAVQVFDGSQQIVKVPAQVVFAGLDHGTVEDRWDVVEFGAVVLVPGHDQQAVVRERP